MFTKVYEREMSVALNNEVQEKLRPAAPGGPSSHSSFFVRVFAARTAKPCDFHLDAMPCNVTANCVVRCIRCCRQNRLDSGMSVLCASCLQWHCSRHLAHYGAGDVCERCNLLSEHDVYGGLSSVSVCDGLSGWAGSFPREFWSILVPYVACGEDLCALEASCHVLSMATVARQQPCHIARTHSRSKCKTVCRS